MKVGFIGLGNAGGKLAGSLLRNDVELTVRDLDKTTAKNLLKEGVAPEMARMVLPQNLYTEWYWSGTLYAFSRVCNLRCAKDTQSETREIANGIRDICSSEFPTSWGELYNVE